jgi:hypothetical protein
VIFKAGISCFVNRLPAFYYSVQKLFVSSKPGSYKPYLSAWAKNDVCPPYKLVQKLFVRLYGMRNRIYLLFGYQHCFANRKTIVAGKEQLTGPAVSAYPFGGK